MDNEKAEPRRIDVLERLVGVEKARAIRAERERERVEGRARVGGMSVAFPGYVAAYVSAARVMLDDAEAKGTLAVLAIPCLHTQRHAMELILKQIVSVARAIDYSRRALAARRLGGAPPPPPKTHDLLKLEQLANTELARIGWSSLPGDVTQLARELAQFEGGDETQLRYSTGKDGNRSFSQRIVAPVREWQERLERASAGMGLRVGEEETFYEELAWESYASDQALIQEGLIDLDELVSDLAREQSSIDDADDEG